jgi:excisionase family DNA binding protein
VRPHASDFIGANTADQAATVGADAIAAYIDLPRSRVYALVSAKRIPIHKDGSALIARKSDLDDWIVGRGGKRA